MFVNLARRCLMAAAIISLFSLPVTVPTAQAQPGVGGISATSAGARFGVMRSPRKHARRGIRSGRRWFGGRRAGRFTSGKGWFAGQRWFGGKPRHGARTAYRGHAGFAYGPVAYRTIEYTLEADIYPVAPVARPEVVPGLRFVRLPAVYRVRQAGSHRHVASKRVRRWSTTRRSSARVRVVRPGGSARLRLRP